MPKAKYTLELVKELIAARGGTFLSLEVSYAHEKYLFGCEKSHIWKTSLSSVLAGHWCGECEINKTRNTLQDAIALATSKRGYCRSLLYINNITDMEWECEFGHIWLSPFRNMIGGWCFECWQNKKFKYTWKSILDICSSYGIIFENCPLNIDEPLRHTENKNKEWCFLCFCGKRFYPIIQNIRTANTTSCGCQYRSRPETEIEWHLSLFNLDIINNSKKIIPPLELDIFIPKLKKAIEYDGERWHNSQYAVENGVPERDTLKNKLCIDNDIKLLRVREKDWLTNKELQLQVIIDFIFDQ